MAQFCSNLEEATERYLGKLIRIRQGDDTLSNREVGIVTKVETEESMSQSAGRFIPVLSFVKRDGSLDKFYVDQHGWAADVYGGQS